MESIVKINQVIEDEVEIVRTIAYTGIFKGGFILLMHAKCGRNFAAPPTNWMTTPTLFGSSDHQYGKWSTSGVRYLKV